MNEDVSMQTEERLRVALTFDAEHPDRPECPPGNAERILETLRDAEVRATFFIQGRWAEAAPDVARRIADDGHLIGNHSTYHARMTLFSDDGLRTDVRDAEATIGAITGVDPRPWFRCPFGEGHADPRVLGALDDLGYRNVHWDVEAEDWEPWRTPADVRDAVVDGALGHGDGAVVLLHTWPGATAEALPLAIAAFDDARTTLVTLEDLEALP